MTENAKEQVNASTQDEPTTIAKAILQVQQEVIVPKARHNKFGNYNYRSLEDIVAALKEPCAHANLMYIMTDDVVEVAGRVYVRATITASLVSEPSRSVTVSAYARETLTKKGLDDAQITGAASSYARKYALCGLFAIDGQDDADALYPQTNTQKLAQERTQPFVAHCKNCGTRYQFDNMQQYVGYIKNNPCCNAPDWVIDNA